MLKKASTLIVLFLMIALAFNPLLGSAETTAKASETIYVDDDNTSGPWDGTEDYPFQNIQDGIDVAEPGDAVYVCDGFYNEQVFINKTINFQGESMEDTIIDGTGLGRLCTIEETNNVVVSGFTFQNAEKDTEALLLYYSIYSVIEHNRFTQNKDVSLYVGGGGHLISENEFIDNSYGNNTIWIISTSNTLVNNIIKNNTGSGISIVARNTTVIGNIIEDNEDNEDNGIVVFNYPSIQNIIISDNIIQRNKVGIRCSILNADYVITNNTISKNLRSGIIFPGRYSIISHNTIENNPIGLLQRAGSVLNNISHNTFASNTVGIQNFETVSNNYTENNFIKNMVHTSFFNYLPISHYQDRGYVFNTWDNNYWDNWRFDRPKPIFGLYCYWFSYVMPLPYCLYDQNPASEPFDMEA